MRHRNLLDIVAMGADRPLRNSLAAVVGLFALFATALLTARADDRIRAVRLSNVVGTVQILNGTETQFSQAYPNMPLTQGSTLKTGEDGRAEVQFEDGSVVRLTPSTSLALSVLSRSSDGSTQTDLELMTGLSYVEMTGTANQHLTVHFGNNQVVSPAPAKFRVNLDANPVELAMLDGSAHLANGSAYSVDVRSGETVRFDANDSNRYFLAEGVDGDSWDQWNTDRDQAMSQMAAQQTREARGSVNPNDPGWNDLDHYGSWYQGGGGSVWSPNGVGAGWDPYGSGYWGYYGSGGGYVWISGYPWGWLPYRCGSWSYYDAFGWGWSPGTCYTNLYPYQSIGYAPPGYHRLPRPTGGIAHPRPLPGGGIIHPLPGRNLIAVDRGPEATEISPLKSAAVRTVAINGETARLLPKTPNPAFGSRNLSNARPAVGVLGFNGSPGDRIVYRSAVTVQSGAIPVYRPVSPNIGSRAPAPASFGSRSGGGPVAASGFRSSAPSMSSASSMPSHASASAPTGGGHPK